MGILPIAATAQLDVTAHSSLEQLRLSDDAAGTTQVDLVAARNEWEAFQVTVEADGVDVDDIEASMSPLVNGDGVELPSAVLYRQHFVPVLDPTPLSQYPPDQYPDALIPFVDPATGDPLDGAVHDAIPFDLSSGSRAVLWVDVYVPSDVPAGEYLATLTVTASGQSPASLPVRLQVWDVVLPDVPALRSAFGLSARRVAEIYGLDFWPDQAAVNPLARAYYDLLLAHGLSPSHIHGTAPGVDPATGDPDFQTSGAPGHGTPQDELTYYLETRPDACASFGLPFYTNWPWVDPLGADRTPARNYLAQWAQHLEQQGWPGRGYMHASHLDEPDSLADYDAIRAWGALFDEAEASAGVAIPMMVTEQPVPEEPEWGTLVGAIDIWVPLFEEVWKDLDFYETGAITERLAAGDEVWSYTALAYYSAEYGDLNGWPNPLVDSHSPKWQIDYSPINHRLPAWVNALHGITGLLYWDTLWWEPGHDVWSDAGNYVHVDGELHNGEGFLIYPGRADEIGFDGPVPSRRLKWLRDSVEDFAVMELLKARGEGDFVERKIQTFARGFGDWDDDPAALLRARRALGERLDSRWLFSDGFESGDASAWTEP